MSALTLAPAAPLEVQADLDRPFFPAKPERPSNHLDGSSSVCLRQSGQPAPSDTGKNRNKPHLVMRDSPFCGARN